MWGSHTPGKIHRRKQWLCVDMAAGTDIRYLTLAEAKRLTNACDPDFRPLVQAALHTGARYGELVPLHSGFDSLSVT
jgi:integrase